MGALALENVTASVSLPRGTVITGKVKSVKNHTTLSDDPSSAPSVQFTVESTISRMADMYETAVGIGDRRIVEDIVKFKIDLYLPQWSPFGSARKQPSSDDAQKAVKQRLADGLERVKKLRNSNKVYEFDLGDMMVMRKALEKGVNANQKPYWEVRLASEGGMTVLAGEEKIQILDGSKSVFDLTTSIIDTNQPFALPSDTTSVPNNVPKPTMKPLHQHARPTFVAPPPSLRTTPLAKKRSSPPVESLSAKKARHGIEPKEDLLEPTGANQRIHPVAGPSKLVNTAVHINKTTYRTEVRLGPGGGSISRTLVDPMERNHSGSNKTKSPDRVRNAPQVPNIVSGASGAPNIVKDSLGAGATVENLGLGEIFVAKSGITYIPLKDIPKAQGGLHIMALIHDIMPRKPPRSGCDWTTNMLLGDPSYCEDEKIVLTIFRRSSEEAQNLQQGDVILLRNAHSKQYKEEKPKLNLGSFRNQAARIRPTWVIFRDGKEVAPEGHQLLDPPLGQDEVAMMKALWKWGHASDDGQAERGETKPKSVLPEKVGGFTISKKFSLLGNCAMGGYCDSMVKILKVLPNQRSGSIGLAFEFYATDGSLPTEERGIRTNHNHIGDTFGLPPSSVYLIGISETDGDIGLENFKKDNVVYLQNLHCKEHTANFGTEFIWAWKGVDGQDMRRKKARRVLDRNVIEGIDRRISNLREQHAATTGEAYVEDFGLGDRAVLGLEKDVKREAVNVEAESAEGAEPGYIHRSRPQTFPAPPQFLPPTEGTPLVMKDERRSTSTVKSEPKSDPRRSLSATRSVSIPIFRKTLPRPSSHLHTNYNPDKTPYHDLHSITASTAVQIYRTIARVEHVFSETADPTQLVHACCEKCKWIVKMDGGCGKCGDNTGRKWGYGFMVVLSDDVSRSLVWCGGKDANDFLPLLPEFDPTELNRYQSISLKKVTDEVHDILMGPKRPDGTRQKPFIDWTFAPHKLMDNRTKVTLRRIFGMVRENKV